LPSLSSGGQYPGVTLPGRQIQPSPAEGAPSGIVILNGMIDISGASHAGGIPMAASDGAFKNNEARAVQDMLFSLRYVPSAQSEEISEQPTLAPSAPSSAPSVLGSPPSLFSSPPSLPSSSPSLLSSPPSFPNGAPSLPSSSPSFPNSAPSAPSSAPSLSSSPSPSFPSSAPSSSSGYAPASTSLDSIGRQPAQHATEGGMVSLLRQPVAQASTIDKISIAAIDALLEIPAKVDGVQGRFQAFEISVTSETSLPVAPLPTGAQINSPFEPANDKTPPVTDPNLHGAWIPSDSAGAIPQFTLPSVAFSSTAFPTAAAPLAGDSLPFGELSHDAIDAAFSELSSEATDNAFSSSQRLDLAAATLLAALIGRALWPARVPKADGQEKTVNSREPSTRPARLRLHWIVPG